jgi:hypothetical protein
LKLSFLGFHFKQNFEIVKVFIQLQIRKFVSGDNTAHQ